MIKAIVIDDEWYNLEEISERVEKTGFIDIVGKYQNPLKALEEMFLTCPHIAFIDIELPEMDGITLAEKLLESNPSIIIVFITSWNQYAVQAFDLNALDYILKPIKTERFNRMVEKIKNEINLKSPHTSSKLTIKCFNQLEVSIGAIPVKWERAKAEEVFAYLLMHHGKYIHKEKIVESLWAEYEPTKALQILQTSVCKIRNLFSSIRNNVKLDYSGNRYCLIIENEACDYLQVEKALADFRVNDRTTYHAIENACILYEKGFLTEQGYIWSIAKDQELRECLIMSLKEMLKAYHVEGVPQNIINVLQFITRLAPFDEKINYKLIKMYKEFGYTTAALSHYEWLKKVLKEEYETGPSERIKKLM